jgi:hypothetical protein
MAVHGNSRCHKLKRNAGVIGDFSRFLTGFDDNSDTIEIYRESFGSDFFLQNVDWLKSAIGYTAAAVIPAAAHSERKYGFLSLTQPC